MQREALETWLGEGLALEQIGRIVGKHPSTVAYWVQKHGLSAANKARHAARGGIPPETLAALVASNLTIREIASELDRSTATVRHWLRRYGLRTRRAYGVAAGLPRDQTTAVGQCPHHGQAVFIRRNDTAWRCTQCRSEQVSRRRRQVKAILVAEAGGACILCGYDRHARALEFHHVDPSTKSFGVASVGVSLSLARARAEARKCVLLCSNCHAEVESGVVTLPS